MAGSIPSVVDRKIAKPAIRSSSRIREYKRRELPASQANVPVATDRRPRLVVPLPPNRSEALVKKKANDSKTSIESGLLPEKMVGDAARPKKASGPTEKKNTVIGKKLEASTSCSPQIRGEKRKNHGNAGGAETQARPRIIIDVAAHRAKGKNAASGERVSTEEHIGDAKVKPREAKRVHFDESEL